MTISVGTALVVVILFAAAFGFVYRFAPPGTIRTALYCVLGFLGFIVLLGAFGLLSGGPVIRLR